MLAFLKNVSSGCGLLDALCRPSLTWLYFHFAYQEPKQGRCVQIDLIHFLEGSGKPAQHNGRFTLSMMFAYFTSKTADWGNPEQKI